jgi:type II secretory pathway pseudopilin PulG
MRKTPGFQQLRGCLIICAFAIIVAALAGPSDAQVSPGKPPATTAVNPTPTVDLFSAAWAEELNKYPGLLPELAHLVEKLRQNVTFPAPRTESHILPLLSDSTEIYVSSPNYGEPVRQSLDVLREELKQSAVLRDWWAHGKISPAGPKLEDTLDKISQLYQYLGDETVFSSAADPQQPQKTSFIFLAQIRKPGLDSALRQWLAAFPGGGAPIARVSDSKQLVAAADSPAGQKPLLILVRPDFVVASSDLAALRDFDAHLTSGKREFAPSPFGQRVAHEYAGGLTLLGAVDLQRFLKESMSASKENQQPLQRSGLGDVQYLVWKRAPLAGQIVGQGKLSFTGPRRGAAAWLAKPGPLGSLDFLSPKAPMAVALNLVGLSQIFDDLQVLAGPSRANAFAGIAAGEAVLNIKLKEDLLDQLSGEVAFEFAPSSLGLPDWKVILKVNDADHVAKTLNTLLTATHVPVDHADNSGITFNTVHTPGQKPMDISYAIAGGYLVVAPRTDLLAEALRLHGSTDSLAKSPGFLASLPPGQSSDASAVFYQKSVASTTLPFQSIPSQFADIFSRYVNDAPPSVMRFYAEPSAIREVSTSSGMDVGTILIVAAIAIPNLLRSRAAANEALAVGSIRTVNTAQIKYSGKYPKIGFAPDLAALGQDPKDPKAVSSNRSGFLSTPLAALACTGNSPCVQSGYEFHLSTACQHAPCTDYVAVAIPVSGSTGTKTFCSTSDGVIRVKPGPATWPVSVAECRSWPLLH